MRARRDLARPRRDLARPRQTSPRPPKLSPLHQPAPRRPSARAPCLQAAAHESSKQLQLLRTELAETKEEHARVAGALEAERKLRRESQKIEAEAALLRAKVEEMTEDSVAALRQARAPPRAARRAAPPPRSRLRRGRATAPSCALPRSRVQAREFVKDGREGIELDVVTLERVLAEFGLLQRWVAEMQQASPTPAPSIFHATSIAIPIGISR